MQRVAVIGGGWTGLSAATRLIDLGISNVSVFDMGVKGPGGRGSSRAIDTFGIAFDYGAQFLDPVPGGEFGTEIQRWVTAGVAAPWSVPVRVLDQSGRRMNDSMRLGPGFCGVLERWQRFHGQEGSSHFYVGTPSMGSIPLYLATQVELGGGRIVSGTKVKKVVWDESTSQWNVSGTNRRNGDAEEDQNFGDFDALIVADALTAIPDSAGYIGLLDLETHKAQGVGEIARQMSKLKHQPVFTLMVSFPNALPIDYDAAFVLGSEAPFQWLARDSSKPGRCSKDNVRDNWTAITSYQYARQLLQRWPLHVQGAYNPQTSLYREAIAKELVAEFVKFLNFGSMPNASSQLILEEGALYKAQRWGRAFLTTPLSQDFLASDKEMFIACGDFCGGSDSGNATTIPPSPLESAWQSGRRAAEHLASLLG